MSGGWHGGGSGGMWHGGSSQGGTWHGSGWHGGYGGGYHGGYYGGGYHGGYYGGYHGGGWYGGVFVGGPWWWGAYPYAYGYPYPYAYSYPYYSTPYAAYPPVDQGPSVYIQQPIAPAEASAPPPAMWYYCPSSKAYYPTVKKCRVDWIEVPPTPQ